MNNFAAKKLQTLSQSVCKVWMNLLATKQSNFALPRPTLLIISTRKYIGSAAFTLHYYLCCSLPIRKLFAFSLPFFWPFLSLLCLKKYNAHFPGYPYSAHSVKVYGYVENIKFTALIRAKPPYWWLCKFFCSCPVLKTQ